MNNGINFFLSVNGSSIRNIGVLTHSVNFVSKFIVFGAFERGYLEVNDN